MAQKNTFGVNIGMANYGGAFLTPKYQGKYTEQNGKSFDFHLSYSRLFANREKGLTLNVGMTNRTKRIIADTLPHALQQIFLNTQIIYNTTVVPIVEERVSLRVGSGLYWNMLIGEADEFLDESKGVETRSSGSINNIGLMMDFPLYIKIRNNQYVCIGNQWSLDLINSVENSHLFVWKLYAGFVLSF